MNSLMESEDYKGAFKTEDKPATKEQENKPFFMQGTSGPGGNADTGAGSTFNPFGFNLLRQPEKK